MTEPLRSPKVFLSYSHDSVEHKDRVLAICDRLRINGIEAWLDQYEIGPPEGWPRWCARQVEEADFVLVVCTEAYERRFRGVEESGRGLGVRWEGHVVTQEIYDSGARNTKFIPVLIPPAAFAHVPSVLRSASHYDLSVEEEYWSLYRHLTGQSETPAPALGTLVPLSPRERQTERFVLVPEARYEDDRTRRLGEELAAAKRLSKELTIAGHSTDEVRQEILRVRREMREGGRLQAGDWLADGRFQLLEVVGRGGFATVWKAWAEETQELVAAKVLHGLHAEDRTRRERFFRGARKMAGLLHPGIVRVIESHLTDGGYHFFIMEYVAGGDLEQTVLAGKLSPRDALPLISAVGEALAFAHKTGIVHRDVKPANILLDVDRAKLTDFDLVRAFDTTGGTLTQHGMGTFLYTAPEMLSDATAAEDSADVYSLAMTAIFALSGKKLPLAILKDAGAVIARLSCSMRLRDALRRAVSWEPTERASLNELCEELSLGVTKPVARRKVERPREPKAGEEWVNEADEAVLLYVPGGEYDLGPGVLSAQEEPIHRVILSPFWIGKYSVTNRQFGFYIEANPDVREPEYWRNERFNQPRQPVVGVSWEDAKAYCSWAGLLLPSEAQWEAAARGMDQRRFPWGNEEPTPEHANFGNRKDRATPVGAYPRGAGALGALDQAGNVWEWCEDVWDPKAYQRRDGMKDPLATCGEPSIRCLRGGSWFYQVRFLAATYRHYFRASVRVTDFGFRCVLPANPER